MLVSAFDMVAAWLPQPFSIVQAPNWAAIEIRDLQHGFTIQIPYAHLTTVKSASRYFAQELSHYQSLLAAWHGRRPLVWS